MAVCREDDEVEILPHCCPNFGLVAGSSNVGAEAGGERVCLTESCVKTAARLLRQMDRAADPCQDFYQFACGGFIADTVLPEHKTRLGSYDLLRDELNKKLKALFESEPQDSEPRIYQGRGESNCLMRFRYLIFPI